jgi:hypothetical protein
MLRYVVSWNLTDVSEVLTANIRAIMEAVSASENVGQFLQGFIFILAAVSHMI